MKLVVILVQACLFLIASEVQHAVAAKPDKITQPPIMTTMMMSSSSNRADALTDASTGASTDSSMDSSMDASTGASTDSSMDSSMGSSMGSSMDFSTIGSTGAATLPTSANTVAFECPSLVVDVFADPDNCHRFYFCVFGTKLSLECDDYKLFNPYTRSCDVVDCNIGPSCLCA